MKPVADKIAQACQDKPFYAQPTDADKRRVPPIGRREPLAVSLRCLRQF